MILSRLLLKPAPTTRPLRLVQGWRHRGIEPLEQRVLLSNGVSFGTPPSFAVGSQPYSVAVGDFNGDGKSDLAVVNAASGTVSVLLGNGNGTFQSDGTYNVGSNPRWVTVGDFTHSGFADLAVANAGSASVSILLGNGNGTFQNAVNYNAGNQPNSVAVGDFTGNGNNDLAVADFSDDSVAILLGNGNGTFQAPMEYGTGSEPRAVAVGDFTGDGIADLAVANVDDDTVSVLLGNGNGTFQAAVNYGVGSFPNDVITGDFNGDGITDIAVANANSNSVCILLGYGNGTFQPEVQYGTGQGPTILVAGDFNGDGRTDLATSNEVDGTVSILLGNGNGTFQNRIDFGAGSFPRSLASGDFNGDGHLDLVTANQGGDSVSVLLNTATASIAGNVSGMGNVTVYLDANNNGQLDPSDTAVVTGPSGNFTFGNLTAGTYQVREVVPSNYSLTTPAAGDTNVTVATGQAVTIQNFTDQLGNASIQQPVYRLYSPVTAEHLYTSDFNEYTTLATRGWTQEGIAYYDYNGPATVDGVTDEPVYRLYDLVDEQHLWTTDFNEYNTLRTYAGFWTAEGVAGYVFPTAVASSTPLYRLSYAFVPGIHLWTTDLNETNTLIAEDGWTSEGITGYVL